MSFVTEADHAAHNAALMPLFPLVNPINYPTTEAYLRAVAVQMANFAKISYRNGQGSQWSTILYVHGIKDRQIHQLMLDTAKAHVGSGTDVSLLVHISMPKGKVMPVTIASLGLTASAISELQNVAPIEDRQTKNTQDSPEQAATTTDTPA